MIYINIHIPLYLVLKIDFYSVSNACEFFSVNTTHLQSSGERAHRADQATDSCCWSLLGLVSIGLNLLESYGSTMAEIQSIGREIAGNLNGPSF